jgi:hypothetical protein
MSKRAQTEGWLLDSPPAAAADNAGAPNKHKKRRGPERDVVDLTIDPPAGERKGQAHPAACPSMYILGSRGLTWWFVF